MLISGARGAKDAGEQSPFACLAVVVTVTSCGMGCCACVCAGEVAGASDVVAVVGSGELVALELELELELDCATASENWGSLGLAELSASSAQDTSAMLSGNAAAQASVRERTDFRGIGMS